MKRVMSAQDKFRKTLTVAKEICGVYAEQNRQVFEYRYKQLKEILDSWQSNKDFL